MTVYRANTDPDLLTRLKQMLDNSARADIAVGYFFMSGFAEVMDDLSRPLQNAHHGVTRRRAYSGIGDYNINAAGISTGKRRSN